MKTKMYFGLLSASFAMVSCGALGPLKGDKKASFNEGLATHLEDARLTAVDTVKAPSQAVFGKYVSVYAVDSIGDFHLVKYSANHKNEYFNDTKLDNPDVCKLTEKWLSGTVNLSEKQAADFGAAAEKKFAEQCMVIEKTIIGPVQSGNSQRAVYLVKGQTGLPRLAGIQQEKSGRMSVQVRCAPVNPKNY